ncbi:MULTISPECIES: DUF4190 domain-containing protein [unclassified Streptomyces]|uniref:DUF4190 domain-containing protein n=1 Tax=unclassified Streptomyces TaxID=2593676 RepID=UPI0001D06A40|nr:MULTISPECIES: DUF4190 domain-containing protein [unclassified Streptomyces]MYS41977.1 DUF4190 domain-containing protein [Streptomyces sp. SID5998]NED76276.1 DUF4190 domain-containing protein [Streptomyces sp. SID9944]EFF89065.1 membrane protein [Streptomyces sp. e14]MYX26476.1 DUF4190 domain-containing protein [Streptomyces sp. SID8381]NED36875.1 DUF4190 domain-containing protein [Streptomyces sp. SID8499]
MSGYGSSPATSTASRTNGLAIAGLVCGIIGVFFLNVVLGPLAIIFGAVALRQTADGGGGRGMAKAGVVLGIIDLVIFFVLLAVAASNGGFTWYVGS